MPQMLVHVEAYTSEYVTFAMQTVLLKSPACLRDMLCSLLLFRGSASKSLVRRKLGSQTWVLPVPQSSK